MAFCDFKVITLNGVEEDQTELDAAGAEGFCLVQIVPDPRGVLVAYLQRESAYPGRRGPS